MMPAAGLRTHVPRYGLSASTFLGSAGLWEPGPVALGGAQVGVVGMATPPPPPAISPPSGPAGSPGSRVRSSGGSGWQPAGSSEPAAGRAALGPGAEPPPPPPACGRRPAAARSPLGSLGPGRDLLLSPGLVHPPPSCPLLWYSIASYSSLLPTGRVSMALGLEGLKLSCLRQPSDLPHSQSLVSSPSPHPPLIQIQVAMKSSSPPGWGGHKALPGLPLTFELAAPQFLTSPGPS